MKINKINIYSFHVRGDSEWIFLEIISTNGISGLSELTMSNKHFLQKDLVKLIKTQINKLLPEDLNDDIQIKNILEEGESEINNSLVLATVISGVRSACSDIFAQNKSLSLRDYLVKFYKLPKIAIDAVPLYANINRSLLPNNNGPVDRSANSFKLKAKKAIKDGFKFIKCAPFDQYPESFYKDKKFISEGFKRISSVVSLFSNNEKLLVDCHSKFNLNEAIEAEKMLFKKGVEWFEEPVNPKISIDDLKKIKTVIKGSLVGGEEFYGENKFLELLNTKVLDILMPDIKYCGGIEEAIKIGIELSKISNQSFSIHCPSGPISLLGSAHVTSALNSSLPLEHAVYEISNRYLYISPPEKIINGKFCFPEGTGLGAKLNLNVPHKLISSIKF